MTGNTMIMRIALAALMVVVVASSSASEEALVRKARSAELKNQESLELVSQGNNTVQVESNPLEYTIKLSMVNFGSTLATVRQRYLLPSAVEVISYSVAQPSNNATTTKNSEKNQRLTQWVGGKIVLKKMDAKDAELIYVNHPEQVINLQSKTFHKLAAAILVRQCESVGGEIFSPNYPVRYPNGADISWLIAYPEGNFVRLEMLDYSTEECCDRVIVYDGYNKTHSPLATFDGEFYTSQDNVVLSTKPAMFITFTSDCLGTSRGFRASYINQRHETSTSTTSPTTTSPPPPMSCGSVQISSGNSGYVYSPNYPGTYGENMDCTWSVETSEGTLLEFVFENFNLSSGDYLDMYDGTPNNPGNLIARMSGSVSSGYTINANSNQAVLNFTSDSYSYNGNKFLISYNGNYPPKTTTRKPETTTTTKAVVKTTTEDMSGECGYHMPETCGIILSPGFPYYTYSDSLNLLWTVQVYSYRYVLFTLQFFRTEECCDYVNFYKGTPSDEEVKTAQCKGHESPGTEILIDDYQAYVTFYSDGSVTDNGFNITYSAVYTNYGSTRNMAKSKYLPHGAQVANSPDDYTSWMKRKEKANVRPKVMGLDLWGGEKNRPLRRKNENSKDAEAREIPDEKETLQ